LILNFTLILGIPFATSDTTNQPKYGGTLIVERTSDPNMVNPVLLSGTGVIYGQVFEGLISLDTDLTLRPELATSWTESEDGLSWTFTLRDNVTFHDGTPLTSADVKWSLEAAMEYNSATKSNLIMFDSIEAPDNYTVVIRLQFPYPLFPKLITREYVNVVPKHVYNTTDIETNEFNWKPIGSGPFKFKEWVDGDHITLERYENYWQEGKPYLDKIVMKIVPGSTAKMLALEVGEVDYLPGRVLTFSDISRLAALEHINHTINGYDRATIITCDVGFNMRHEILGIQEVRQAIAHAIDKQEWVDKVYYGWATPVDSLIPESCDWGYNPDAPKYEYNVAKANQMLDQAGFPLVDGTRFSFEIICSTVSDRGLASEIFVEQMEDVGIDVTFTSMKTSALKNIVGEDPEHPWDAYMMSKVVTNIDPLLTLRKFFHSDMIKLEYSTSMNIQGYNNSRVDELFDLAMPELNLTKRGEYTKELQDILNTELPIIPGVDKIYVGLFNNAFMGIPSGASCQVGLEGWDDVYWIQGSTYSEASATDLIAQAESEVERLGNEGYDVTEASASLAQAKNHFATGDWTSAYQSAEEALNLCSAMTTQRLLMYVGIIAVVIIVIVAVVFIWRRRRSPKGS
jgi:peptide/nickel transport system substrate-binding protein